MTIKQDGNYLLDGGRSLHLPTLLDGLRSEEVIAAARESDAVEQWVDVNL